MGAGSRRLGQEPLERLASSSLASAEVRTLAREMLAEAASYPPDVSDLQALVGADLDGITFIADDGGESPTPHGIPKRARGSDSLAAMRRLLTSVAAALALGLVAGAAGCSGPAASPDPTTTSVAQVLAATKATVDRASSLHLTLTGKDLPGSFSGIVSADGVGTHAPAFKGTFQVKVGTTQASADVVAVDGATYVKLPFTSIYAPVSPDTLGAPDPARLFTPATGITSLLTATTDAVKGGQTRKGSEVLTTYTGHLPGATIVDLLVIGDKSGVFDVTYGITDAGQLRTVSLTGPFYAGVTSTYDVILDRYGEPVEITKP